MNNIITQVDDSYTPTPASYNENIDYNSKIHLNVRGTEFVITRDELMLLPESILLCLFPNGVFLDMNGQVITNLTEDDIVLVNFDCDCFQYIIDAFSSAQHDLAEMPPLSPVESNRQENVLQNKPAIIVLREDLDYYVIPPESGLSAEEIKHIKLQVAHELLRNKLIFSGLGFKPDLPPQVHQTLGSAEQHLFDMLCTSGFDPRGSWGNRLLEPSKCVISLLLLVRLKTHQESAPASNINTPPDSPLLAPVASNASSSGRSRLRLRLANLANSARAASRSLSKLRKTENTNPLKLLLFWRKPARKCWWSSQEVEVDLGEKRSVKVHIRRVWTLELSVVGIQ